MLWKSLAVYKLYYWSKVSKRKTTRAQNFQDVLNGWQLTEESILCGGQEEQVQN